MRRTCNPPRSRARPTSRTTIAGLFSLLLAAPSFADDEDPRWNIAGWTPSIAASVGVHVTDMTGYINATDSADNPVRPPVDTQDFAIVPMIRVSLDLESPPIHERLGDVRAFFGVDYFATLPPGRNITAEGNPASFFIRDGILDPPEQAIEGQGSALAVRTNRLAYGATAGLAVPIEILGIRVFVKPGVSWMRQQWDLDGVVKRAFKVIRPPMVFSREFRGVELDANGQPVGSERLAVNVGAELCGGDARGAVNGRGGRRGLRALRAGGRSGGQADTAARGAAHR